MKMATKADYQVALALRLERRPDAALPHILAVRRAEPENIDGMLLHGQLLVELYRFEEAVAIYRAALALAPDRYQVVTHLGVALFELDQFDEALALLRQAFAMAPQNARVIANLGHFLDFAGSVDLAISAYEAALSVVPNDREILVNYGMALLRAGRLAEGWALFETRLRIPDPIETSGVPHLPPLTATPDLSGRRILLFHEQGFGDTLQMLRYIPLLAAHGAEIVLRMPPALKRLAARVGGTLADDTGVTGYDFYCPMMSLPMVFGTVLETIPAEIPYLNAPEAEGETWRRRLAALPGPRIGLVWAGSPRGGLDRRRSMRFDRLAPLFALPASFVSLQLGEAGRGWAPPPGTAALDPTGELVDFADTAALVSALDLVITVDTSVAHLAGALGKPVWVLSRFSSCWRWLMGRADSPWYPTMRIFRQRLPGDWAGLIAEVEEALRERLAAG
ncbi:MAG TPA: tetratricopeptide repeat protein [Aliidongia sp.]|nr:tetratricopeptide repeat protein [Aliidongia sp.]